MSQDDLIVANGHDKHARKETTIAARAASTHVVNLVLPKSGAKYQVPKTAREVS